MSALLTKAKQLQTIMQISNMKFHMIVAKSADEEGQLLSAFDKNDPNLHVCVLRLYAN